MKELTFKAIRLIFNEETGYLRDLTYRGQPVLSALYPAVRDKNWGTLNPFVTRWKEAKTSPVLLVSWEGIW